MPSRSAKRVERLGLERLQSGPRERPPSWAFYNTECTVYQSALVASAAVLSCRRPHGGSARRDPVPPLCTPKPDDRQARRGPSSKKLSTSCVAHGRQGSSRVRTVGFAIPKAVFGAFRRPYLSFHEGIEEGLDGRSGCPVSAGDRGLVRGETDERRRVRRGRVPRPRLRGLAARRSLPAPQDGGPGARRDGRAAGRCGLPKGGGGISRGDRGQALAARTGSYGQPLLRRAIAGRGDGWTARRIAARRSQTARGAIDPRFSTGMPRASAIRMAMPVPP